jgi:hypothetical protein
MEIRRKDKFVFSEVSKKLATHMSRHRLLANFLLRAKSQEMKKNIRREA